MNDSARHPFLEAVRSAGSSFLLLQDGVEQTAHNLLEDAHSLAEEIKRSDCRRVALLSRRIDRLLVSLLAADLANCELLLVRPGSDPELLSAESPLRVSASIGDDGILRTFRPVADVMPGFSVLIMTSGTTGIPKVAAHRPSTLVEGIRVAHGGQETRWLLTYDPTSFAGLQVILTALLSGNTLVAAVSPTVTTLAELAVRHRVTHVSGTPTFWRAFLMVLGSQRERRAQLGSVRQITLGGEAVDQTTLDRLASAFPDAFITHIYASTEAGVLFSVKDGRAGFPATWLSEDRPPTNDASGTAVRMRIREGILEAFSARRMNRYVYAPDKDPITDDGWVHTGDLVRIDGDRVVFLGRADRIINVGGLKVTPDEVEAVLLQVPGVLEVRVDGIANPVTGQLLAADVVAASDQDPAVLRAAINAHARKLLPEYKVPRIIRFVAEIALSDAGKKSRTA